LMVRTSSVDESKNAVAESRDACGTEARRIHFRTRFNEVQVL
jgi:hypothetical protein